MLRRVEACLEGLAAAGLDGFGVGEFFGLLWDLLRDELFVVEEDHRTGLLGE